MPPRVALEARVERITRNKWPPSLVTAAVLECIEEQRFEVVAPRTAAMLFVKWLRILTPLWYRLAMQQYDPVPPALLAEAMGEKEKEN